MVHLELKHYHINGGGILEYEVLLVALLLRRRFEGADKGTVIRTRLRLRPLFGIEGG